MMNFTQTSFKKQALLLFALVLWGTVASAQSHTVTVNSPASVAGNYVGQIAAFGPGTCQVDMVSGDLLIVSDTAMSARGCGSISTDLTGKIAVIDRGVCGFNEKVYNAQLKGAIAVLVVNNSAAAIITMAAAAPFDALTTIPSFMISQADGNKIKAALAMGVNVTVKRNDVVDTSTDIVVWGNDPGEGDFDGGLAGWTVSESSCASGADTIPTWTWSANGAVRGSCGGATIASPTRCNGAAVFESDFLDSGTGPCGGGSGVCGAAQYGELISPNIDVSASDANGFSVKFYQLSRQFQSNYYVSWSTDGGATWIDTTQINTELVVNAAAASNLVRVALTGTSNANTIQVKFIYEANYYFWGIDDVKIIEQESFNLQANETFFAVPPNAITPLSEVEPFGFLADIENVGASAQDNVTLNMTITDADFTPIFSTDLSYGTVPANTLIENIPFDETYTPQDTGTFYGFYTISGSQPDFDSTNNQVAFAYIIDENTFAKEYGATRTIVPAASNWSEGEAHSWAYGNYFYVPNGGLYTTGITFGLGNATTVPALVGRDLILQLYKWDDVDGDGIMGTSDEERIPVGTAFYTITGTETTTQLITVPLPGPDDDPIQLEGGSAYVAMVEYYSTDAVDLALLASDDIDYSAMVFLTAEQGAPRYAGMLGINDDLSTEPYSSVGFGYDVVPVVRLNVAAEPTSIKDLSKLNNEFTVFPNPTSNDLNVQLNLDKQAQTATVRLFDLSGKMIQQWSYDNVQKERFQYNVNKLSSGTYFLQVITEAGAGTKKFTVAK